MNLFPSTLIIGKNKDSIHQKIDQFCNDLDHQFNQNNPDILLIDENSGWGIDQIRKINNFLSQKPFCHQSKIVIIIDAQNLNNESQNALLKNLEEPGENNYIILTTNKTKSILETIISRCQTIKIVETHHDASLQKHIEITGNLTKDLTLSEKLGKNKEDILPMLEKELYIYQQELVNEIKTSATGGSASGGKKTQTIEKIIKAIQMINANVDPKSALDYIFLS